MSTLFPKLTKIYTVASEKLQLRRFQPPHCGLTTVIGYLESQKLESLTYISTADSIGLCLLLFTKLFLKVKRSESRSAGGLHTWVLG